MFKTIAKLFKRKKGEIGDSGDMLSSERTCKFVKVRRGKSEYLMIMFSTNIGYSNRERRALVMGKKDYREYKTLNSVNKLLSEMKYVLKNSKNSGDIVVFSENGK